MYLLNREINLEHRGKIVLTIPIDNIKLIGEYNTATGPFVDDWFIVFMTASDECHQISQYAVGMNSLLQQLSEIYNTDMMGTLISSTTWKTNILWPEHIKGKEMWVIEELPAKNWIDRIARKLGFGDSSKLSLSDEAEILF